MIRLYELSWSIAFICLNENNTEWLDEEKVTPPPPPPQSSILFINIFVLFDHSRCKMNTKEIRRISVTFRKRFELHTKCDDRNQNGSKYKLHTNIHLNVVAIVVVAEWEKKKKTSLFVSRHLNKIK